MTMTMRVLTLLAAILFHMSVVHALNVVLAGGTGPMGTKLAARLGDANQGNNNHDVTILCRNAFLAAAPNRVTEQFGWVGASFLKGNPHVHLRDWDGGDLLEIVGQDWIGWADDALKPADVIVHLVGGFTEQRTMACERLIRESFRVNPQVLHITVNPIDQDFAAISPLALASIKEKRLLQCEDMVKANCRNSKCLRVEAFRLDEACAQIESVIEEWAKQEA